MDLLDDILNTTLQPYFKRYTAGDYLFRQGDLASTMYFLINGKLQLIGERPEGDTIEGVLETGQFLGEKVLLQPSPYKRAYSGFCETDLLVLELTQEDVANIEANDPAVMTDLLKTVLRVVGGRFELASFLAQGLRPNDEVSRIVNVVRYFDRAGRRGGVSEQGFALSEEAILKYVDTDRKVVRSTLKALLDKRILVRSANLFVVADEEALLDFAEAR
jgi:CRP-like cAMP-binding protein